MVLNAFKNVKHNIVISLSLYNIYFYFKIVSRLIMAYTVFIGIGVVWGGG